MKNDSDDNPDKFYLQATSSSFNYAFTYDPRAADEWLFHNGNPETRNIGGNAFSCSNNLSK
jgi:hypothetical protein